MSIADLSRRLYDVLVREPRVVWRYYRETRNGGAGNGGGKASVSCGSAAGDRRLMVFKADGRFPHGGMFDRLKGAVSVFAAAQCIGREFRISFTHPFDLREYLEPNEYDWRIGEGELQKVWPKARPVFMYGECGNPVRLVKKRRCESHFYYGYDSLEWLRERFGKDFDFGTLYRHLFKPTPRLQQYIDHYRQEIGGPYIAVHFRFMNLIGDSTEFTEINPTLPEKEQEELIERSLEQLGRIASDGSGVCDTPLQGDSPKLLLATDSPRFTEIVRQRMPEVYIIPGEIRHIGTSADNTEDSNIKMFLDYYLIAGACKVYNLVSQGMWKSAFPEYAAKIGGVPFERVFY